MIIRDRISLSTDGGLARVELARPAKRNALDLPMFKAIVEAQNKLRGDRSVRAVILSGRGEDFCSGLDIKALMNDRAGMIRLLWKWLPWRSNLAQAVSTGWRTLPVPVVAAIQGRCWGGGLQVALGADLRVAGPNASLSVMEGRWGLIPDMGGSLALRENIGRDHALWLSMSAETLDARQAYELGLLTDIADDPVEQARKMAETLQRRSPDALAAVKRLYRKSWTSRPGTVLARETGYQLRILSGANQRIAVARQRGEERDYSERGRW